MMKLRDLTLNDVKDLLDMEGSRFDILVATAARAKLIHETENKLISPPPPPPPKKKRSSSSAASSSRKKKSPSSSAASSSRKRKRNSPKKTEIEQQPPPPPPPPPPPLPAEFEKAIEEMARGKNLTEAARLVIQKRLFPTDLSHDHGRLSMPINQINDFLTEAERRHIRGREGRRKKYIDALILEPSRAVSKGKMGQWDMAKSNGNKTSSSYVINGRWKQIVMRNKLKVNTLLQVWTFRIDGGLCFALVRLPRNVAGDHA